MIFSNLFEKLPPVKKAIARKENLQHEVCTALSNNAVWIYTLMKAGTTYTALFLSNYFNYIFGDKQPVDFDTMNKNFCIHSFMGKIKQHKIRVADLYKTNYFFSKRLGGYEGMFTTHEEIKGALWQKCICLNRNPLDYIISSYFFHYVNRGIKLEHPRKILQEKIHEFSKVVASQVALKEKHGDKVLIASYEDLTTNSSDVFRKIIGFLDLQFDPDAFDFALKYSSKDSVQKMEKKRGEAIVKPDGAKFSGSFIRSGKIGEWQDYFNDSDVELANNIMKAYNLDINNFTLT